MLCSIEVLELECSGCHGVSASEQSKPQALCVSAICTMDDSYVDNDSEGDTYISYSTICKLIRKYVSTQKCALLEQLCADLAFLVVALDPESIEKCQIICTKPDVARKYKSKAVQVSVTMTSDEYNNTTRPDLWLWKRQFTDSNI